MNTELISELYKNQNSESDIDSSITALKTKNYTNGISIEQYTISSHTDHKDPGIYTILNAIDIPYNIDSQKSIINHLSKIFKSYIDTCNKKNILIVGLGNRHISADSLGAKVIQNIIVTRHLPKLKTLANVSAIIPSVLGLTGIESFDIVSGVIDKTSPTLVIAIDSLCASSYTRLGTSFQVNDASIIPGGGVKNARKKFSKTTLGCNFLSIGVPLVIYANTFNNQNIKDLNNLVVTLKDIDETSTICAKIIAYSLNMAIHNISFKEMMDYLNNM